MFLKIHKKKTSKQHKLKKKTCFFIINKKDKNIKNNIHIFLSEKGNLPLLFSLGFNFFSHPAQIIRAEAM